MRCTPVCAIILIAGAACGDNPASPAESHTLETGRYAYSSSFDLPRGYSDLEFTGTLVLTFASEDSIDGRWEVDGFEPELGLGFWNVDAYVVHAQATRGLLVPHRIRPATGSGVACTVSVTGEGENGQLENYDGVCTIEKVE